MDTLESRLADPARLAALVDSGLLDTPPDEDLDRLTRIAARLLGVPVSLVSLVDERRQFFKSIAGRLADPWHDERQTPLSHSFCKHVVADDAPFAVEDARLDPRVRDNLAVRELGVVAYLGMPLATGSGQTLGAFCVVDDAPRAWTPEDRALLADLAGLAADRIELRDAARLLHQQTLRQRQLELQREELLQMLVRDLRNPASSLVGGIEAVEQAKDLPERHRPYLAIARRGGERLLQMVDGILDFGKAEAGRLELERSAFPPLELLRESCETLGALAEGRAVALDTLADPHLPPLVADREKLRRVLVNLVSNAIQHTPMGGRVLVMAGVVESELELVVEDNGSGIPNEALGRIFEKYGHGARKKLFGSSTGLGLPFARMAVEAHGGRIEVESEPARGTRFRIVVPLRP